MKFLIQNRLTFLVLIVLSFSIYFIISTKTICDDLDGFTREGVLYLKGSKKPFSGNSRCIWDLTNVTWYEGKYIDGLKEGLWKFYNLDETKRSEIMYRKGKMNGPRNIFNSNNDEIIKMNCADNICETVQ